MKGSDIPLGRLSRIARGASDTRMYYDGDAMVVEYDASNVALNRYAHGSNAAADDPLVWFAGSGLTQKKWLHADHLGSIVAATDANGATANINSYDEYGIPAATNVGRFQYTGQMWLSEISSGGCGLYYYKARIYDSCHGRFLQTDPVGYEGGVNLYAYVGNDPVNAKDPSGTVGERTGAPSGTGRSTEERARSHERFCARNPDFCPGERAPKFRILDPRKAVQRARQIATEELKRTRRIANGGGHNDIYDAERHARWTYRMAVELGWKWSDLISAMHEFQDEAVHMQPSNEYFMDSHNNAVGLEAAKAGRPIPNISSPDLIYIHSDDLEYYAH